MGEGNAFRPTSLHDEPTQRVALLERVVVQLSESFGFQKQPLLSLRPFQMQ
jgi:hypothetical protein